MAFMSSPKRLTSMMIKKKDSSSHYVRLPSDDENREIRKGHVPMMVGNEGAKEKFMVPTRFIHHPSIIALLDLSADEFGYDQQGVLQIPCEPEYFREIIGKLSKKT
ncbi:hypothetical protein Nepgr_000259 [Nepenthes gracilis]|uniref:Small auxin up regulated protein n=1 Tax=Nepenthes gracilis TaxID=150966 RepID=A0AAD3P478_NEPGR|nr:hypothetical protein Nepgr_000259 [Nepenthes gracilis]